MTCRVQAKGSGTDTNVIPFKEQSSTAIKTLGQLARLNEAMQEITGLPDRLLPIKPPEDRGRK